MGKVYAVLGSPRLGGQHGEPTRTGALEREANCGSDPVEVEVFPVGAEELAVARSLYA